MLDQLLPFEGYEIKNLSISEEDNRPIRIQLVSKQNRKPLCYKCGGPLMVKTFTRNCAEDLPILGRTVSVFYRRYKGKCNSCKKYRLEHVPWLCPRNPRMSMRSSIFHFKLCEIAPVSRVAGVLKRNKVSLWRNDLELLRGQFENYKIPECTKICVDEVYAKSTHTEDENRSDRFFTIISDLDTRKVLWVAKSRRKAALDEFFSLIGKDRCQKILLAATDQHEDYKASINEHCPNVIHVYDRFHLVKKFEEAANKTRIRLYKMLPQEEVRKRAAGKYRFIFLKAASRRTEDENKHLARLLKENQAFIHLELIKERWLTFFDAGDPTEALAIFNELGILIKEAGFPELKRWWARTMAEWKTIINYFTYRISTALAEGINNVIKSIKRRAFGYRNMEYFKLKIMQVCGFLSSDLLNFDGTWTPKAKALLGASNA